MSPLRRRIARPPRAASSGRGGDGGGPIAASSPSDPSRRRVRRAACSAHHAALTLVGWKRRIVRSLGCEECSAGGCSTATARHDQPRRWGVRDSAAALGPGAQYVVSVPVFRARRTEATNANNAIGSRTAAEAKRAGIRQASISPPSSDDRSTSSPQVNGRRPHRLRSITEAQPTARAREVGDECGVREWGQDQRVLLLGQQLEARSGG